MAARIIKSLAWLVGCTGLGYGLLVTLTPKESDLKLKLPAVTKSSEQTLRKRQQVLDVLQAASNSSEPLYRLDKSKIDREIRSK